MTLEERLLKMQRVAIADHDLIGELVEKRGLKDQQVEIWDAYFTRIGIHEQYLIRVLNWSRSSNEQISYPSQLIEPQNPLYDYDLYFMLTMEAHKYAIEYITSKYLLNGD